MLIVVAVPVLVGIVAASRDVWYPHDDYALTEMRVRDVFSDEPPLVGLSGRIHHDDAVGSHPGPLSFYLMAPVYRLLGSSGWALRVGASVLAYAAVGLAVWIGYRRRALTGALAAAAGMVVLLVAYGAERWTMPWNPNIPLMWWPVVLLAAWSVTCRDRAMAPVFVVAGTLCAQTHLPYVGLVGGFGAFVGLSLLWQAWRARRPAAHPTDRPDDGSADEARGSGGGWRWVAVAGALLAVLWLPPIVEQVTNDPGNASIITGQFLHPSESSVGWGPAFEVMSARFDLAEVATGGAETDGASVAGVVLVVAWATTAAVAVLRRRSLPGDLLRLHAVVGFATALGVVSVSRVQGTVYAYLTLWAWGTAAVMLAATVWTLAALATAGRRAPAPARTNLRWAVLATGLLLVVAVPATVDAATTPVAQKPERSALHADVFPQAFDALEDGAVPGFDASDRYLISARDGYTGGMSAFTVLGEAERRGFDAGMLPGHEVSVREFRTLDPEDATAVLTYASGGGIEEMASVPGAVELAHAEPTPAAASEAEAALEDAREALAEAGRSDLLQELDDNVLGLALGGEVPDEAADAVRRVVEAGGPVAMYVSPAPG